MVPRSQQRVQRVSAVALSAEAAGSSRRQLLALIGSAAAVLAAGPAQAKVPAGFNALKDTTKGYAFIYPVGWQARGVPDPLRWQMTRL